MLRDNCAALTGEGIEVSGGIDAKVSAEGLGGEGSCSALRYGDEQGKGRCELLPCVTSWASGWWAQCFGLRCEHMLVAEQG